MKLPTKWLPCGFCAEMTLAVRRKEHPKRQTRRIIIPQPTGDFYPLGESVWYDNGSGGCSHWPRWPVGTGLYFTEPTRMEYTSADDDTPNGCMTIYSADTEVAHVDGKPVCWTAANSGLPSRFMRKCLCRTLGVVTDVRAQRVNEITWDDAVAEGVVCPVNESVVRAFKGLWNTLHPKSGERFEDGPWVYAYTFEVITTDHKEAQMILKESDNG